jgi:hypothetical protein
VTIDSVFARLEAQMAAQTEIPNAVRRFMPLDPPWMRVALPDIAVT